MAAVPFGVVGAVFGHLLFGLDLGMLSVFGIVGLSGVVINDSLVLLDFVNEQRDSGKPIREAILIGAKSRFRPILLTTLTTFLGVFPLIIERSLQAKFLVPMAVSLGIGILFATFIIMVLVPALTMLQHDVGVKLRSWRAGGRGAPAPETAAEVGPA
ncbi:MAG: efflux RND transporter permease subunit, partial [marine benthic group bacterium]|nr:efflux RND transporter permease subunit [Gemmatimonadota bacterium]